MRSTHRCCYFDRGLFRSTLLPMLAAGLLCSAGCGSGEYNRRMKESLERQRRASTFIEHLDNRVSYLYAENEGTAIRWQRPVKLFPYLGDSAQPPLEQPPGMQLPGLERTLIQYAKDKTSRHELAYYCYLYRLSAGTVSSGAIRKDVREQLTKAFPDAEGIEWTDVELDTPDGGTIAWQWISASGPQEFDRQGRDETEEHDGRIEFYLLKTEASPEYVYLFGWRATQSMAESLKLFEAARAALGTVDFGVVEEQPAEEPEE